MGRKVTNATLFDGFHVMNVGTFKGTLPSDNHTLKDFTMNLEDSGVLVLTWTNKAGGKESFGLGVSMIKTVRFAAEDKV